MVRTTSLATLGDSGEIATSTMLGGASPHSEAMIVVSKLEARPVSSVTTERTMYSPATSATKLGVRPSDGSSSASEVAGFEMRADRRSSAWSRSHVNGSLSASDASTTRSI